MVYKDTINLFHDNKNILLKSKDIKLIELEKKLKNKKYKNIYKQHIIYI